MRYIIEQSKDKTWVSQSKPRKVIKYRTPQGRFTEVQYKIIYPPPSAGDIRAQTNWDSITTPTPGWKVHVTKHYDTFEDFMADYMGLFL